MTETHRQRGDADEVQALPDDVSNLATEVIDLTDAPPIVPAEKSSVRAAPGA